MEVWQKLVLLGVAGAFGALSRYGLAGAVQSMTGATFPFGTLAVNALGSFAFGVVIALAEDRMVLSPDVRLIVLTGFMGSFTTFSTFAYESSALMRESQWGAAVANVLAQNALGIVCVLIGLALGGVMTKGLQGS